MIVEFLPPPCNYKRPFGKIGQIRDPGGWQLPRLRYDEVSETWWTERLTGSPGWVHIGHAPRPRSRWGHFWYHWHHGRLMRYPRRAVVVFALRDVLRRWR